MKASLDSAPLLCLPYMTSPSQVTTDASKYQFVEGFDPSIGFYSLKRSDTESRWPAHEQELYAIKQYRDRDPKFMSEFWQELMRIVKVKHRMTLSRLAQVDGRSERQVRTLEDSLRSVVSHYGDDWAKILPAVKYAPVTLISTSSRVSPFEVDCGRNRKVTYHPARSSRSRSSIECDQVAP
ncbi:hypothetical protein PsorP6_016563 [Peronosclerospora sorghi]|uniref:Uncharacterized protein n=1 Tax=Peronosclerospora sorghi TaxID=230839 RepID=A0ACC0VMC5_9STRA|nr:hypothetical protein PsorP6_016563 [Peronosclerospora sorghi]